jgi:hypothetical protein
MIENARKWVEKNGLHPQPCGATIRQFCEAMGVSDETFRRWQKNVAFVEMLNHAREIFHSTTVREVENALVKAARGVDFVHIKEEKKAQKVKEYDEKGRKVKEYDGNPVIVKSVRETIYYPPNVEAAKFILSNMAGEDWKLKQETTVRAQGINIEMILPQEAIDGLSHAIETGAKPRAPKDEE